MKKKPIIVIAICIACMFAWIFVAVALTGGREIEEMSRQDHLIMLGFAAAELLTVLLMIGALVRLNSGKKSPLSPAVRARSGYNLVILVVSIALPCLMVIPGVRLHGAWKSNTVRAVRIFCYALAALSAGGNGVGLWRHNRQLEKLNVEQRQKLLLAHREQAEKMAEKKLRTLKKIRRFTSAYALLLLLMALLLAFCYGMDANGWEVIFPTLLIQIALQQVPFPEPKAVMDKAQNILPEQEYPRLYELAAQAARENGWIGGIQLAVTPESGASIGTVRSKARVVLSALSMGMMTEEEIYALLLHEFAHVAAGNREELRAADYMGFLDRGRNPNFLSGFNGLFYAFPDSLYALEYVLYSYAATLSQEQAADRVMARHPVAAAASLLKLKYYDLYRWEDEAADGAPEFAEREYQVVRKELGRFLQAFPGRKADWERITKRELLARNATHPTTWARIQALGLNHLPTLSFDAEGAYADEREKALDYMDSQIDAYYDKAFEKLHQSDYLEPKERVEAWEQAGCPVEAQSYADVVGDLLCLRRRSEAVKLCDRAIGELAPIAAAFAYFTRGHQRLHQYNADGIADLYRAVELNNNAIDQAMEDIGTFCCLMGLQQELDAYREKAIKLQQQQEDTFCQTGILTRGDRLTAEQLPEGMLEEILTYIGSISQDSIDSIYLVRKIISDTFFTSAFVIRFRPKIQEETRAQVLHQIFSYLDTCAEWQFSLFDYAEIPKALVERIPNSCVYQREE